MLAGHAHAEGELDRRIDGDRLSRAVLAFAAGLASQRIYDPLDEESARSRGSISPSKKAPPRARGGAFFTSLQEGER